MTDRSALPHILFVDDEPKAGELFSRFARAEGMRCSVFNDPTAALDAFREQDIDVVVSDLNMPLMDGIGLLTAVRELDSDTPFIIITGYSTVENAIEALRLGASDFLKKPYDPEELLLSLKQQLATRQLTEQNRLLKRQLSNEWDHFGMVGHSAPMQAVYRLIEKVADIRCNIIIEGESGTGKELVARAIHKLGQTADKPFVVIDCGALSETLLESELFGHEKGAFTGADRSKQGLLEAAHGGTVFLDEIGNISDNLQTKLLRVVQEQQVIRVGGLRPRDIDVRFIVATHRNLEAMIEAGSFRHDLYHRLNVVKIDLPPLRVRREDIADLLQHFIAQLANHYGRQVDGFDPLSMQQLTDYDWPGNVRELRNLVERHIALADGTELHLNTMPGENKRQPITSLDHDSPSLEELERRYILQTLAQNAGNRQRSADVLGINKTTLWRKLQRYGVE